MENDILRIAAATGVAVIGKAAAQKPVIGWNDTVVGNGSSGHSRKVRQAQPAKGENSEREKWKPCAVCCFCCLSR